MGNVSSQQAHQTVDRMINTNMGHIPLEDYLEIVASQYGYDSYEDLKKDGYIIEI